ncbi:MAG: hypothetical protein WAW63_00380 [Candidatus Saccharimonadales bacterium]|nr:hypothetical protein [Candidatus Saccharibacteria bacterium]
MSDQKLLLEPTPMGEITHGGVTLPLYRTQDVVWGKVPLIETVEEGKAGVVRYARVHRLTQFTLGALLDATDSTFSMIAETTGAQVVEHHWGLAVTEGTVKDDHPVLSYAHPSLPEKTSLVAHVQVIPRPHLSIHNLGVIQRIVDDHRTNGSSEFFWPDGVRIQDQFVQTELGLYLTDIEPYILPRNASNLGRRNYNIT